MSPSAYLLVTDGRVVDVYTHPPSVRRLAEASEDVRARVEARKVPMALVSTSEREGWLRVDRDPRIPLAAMSFFGPVWLHPEALNPRLSCTSTPFGLVAVYPAEDLPGIWVANVIRHDLIAQGSSSADAVRAAMEAAELFEEAERERLEREG